MILLMQLTPMSLKQYSVNVKNTMWPPIYAKHALHPLRPNTFVESV